MIKRFLILIPLITILLPGPMDLKGEENNDWQIKIDSFFGQYAVDPLVSFLFWEIPGTEHKVNTSPVYFLTQKHLIRY